MISKPFFSIIIPTYNRYQLLSKAIDSILTQGFNNYEILICDDGSTDETPQLFKQKYTDHRIQYFHLEHKGVSHARNYGIIQSSGEYIAFLDSDDEYESYYLFKAHEFIKKNNYPKGFIRSFSSINNSIQNLELSLNTRELLQKTTIHLPCVICHSSILKEINFNESYKVAEDYNLWIKILNKYPFYEIPIHSVKINQTPNSLSQEGGNLKNLEYVKTILRILKEMKLTNNSLGKWFFKINLANRFSYYINTAYVQKSYKEIISIGFPIIAKYPHIIFYKNNMRTIIAAILKSLTKI